MRTFVSIATAVAIIAMNAATTSSSPAESDPPAASPVEYVCMPNTALSGTKYNTIAGPGRVSRRPTVVLPINGRCEQSHIYKEIDQTFVDYTKMANGIVKPYKTIGGMSVANALINCAMKFEGPHSVFNHYEAMKLLFNCNLVKIHALFTSPRINKLKDLNSRMLDMAKLKGISETHKKDLEKFSNSLDEIIGNIEKIDTGLNGISNHKSTDALEKINRNDLEKTLREIANIVNRIPRRINTGKYIEIAHRF
ncbi:hypothetical protein AYI69_g6263 [Smittium culicis]|uniref:Uncharacterized protein n=1 Tax=Smittium culicis TaxID=133412 RepID=A0A1R1Y0I9_9FUNG|nr:hypothetical protein AYI69_g6263 [Smittium culicis]